MVWLEACGKYHGATGVAAEQLTDSLLERYSHSQRTVILLTYDGGISVTEEYYPSGLKVLPYWILQ